MMRIDERCVVDLNARHSSKAELPANQQVWGVGCEHGLPAMTVKDASKVVGKMTSCGVNPYLGNDSVGCGCEVRAITSRGVNRGCKQ